MSMLKNVPLALLAGASLFIAVTDTAAARDRSTEQGPNPSYAIEPPVPVRAAYEQRSGMGGGLVEFLFGDPAAREGRSQQPSYPVYQTQPAYAPPQLTEPEAGYEEARRPLDPKFEKQLVDYSGKEAAGTIVIDTPNKFLYLVEGGGRALRYGIGVGRPGFTWSGVKTISAKREWPDWTPPAEMLTRRPDLPRHMEGGPENPLGARAMYLGSSLYRIHGSNEPWTIGTNVSSGCIRMRNQDVIDLYGRVNVGTRVIVL
jgi:lipoprotein-anchoring transpeptidase ErfK/SrfK